MRKLLLAILLFTACKSALGQNLVRNPSLEDYDGKIAGWKMIAGTPDIASQDNRIMAKVPFANPILDPEGSPQKLRSIVFGEVCLCQWFNSNGSEVTQVELAEPLKRKEKYEVSLYVIKSTEVDVEISEVSVAITRKELKSSESLSVYQVPYVALMSEVRPVVSSRDEWVRVKAIYTARGGERYLTIGNFAGANRVELAALTRNRKGAYYCYDNVRVSPLIAGPVSEPALVAVPPAAPVVATDTLEGTFTLEDTGFAFNSHQLHETAFSMLDKLVNFLRLNPTATIKVTGFTDDVGKEAANRKLSEKRARAVMEYIVAKGIAIERITAEGLGELSPKASNQSEEGRARNRRVEIKIKTIKASY